MSSAISPYSPTPSTSQFSAGTYNAVPEAIALLNKARRNPLAEFLSEEVYDALRQNDLLNEKELRDFVIRKMFAALKQDKNISATEAMEQLHNIFQYLQPDTIRKIVYRLYPPSPKRPMI